MRRFRRRRLNWSGGYRVGLPTGLRWPISGRLRWGIIVVGIGYLVFRLADRMVLGPLAAAAETEARLRGIEALNRVVISDVAKALRSQELVTYEKDNQGRIAAAHVNTSAVNQLSSDAASLVRDEFRKLQSRDFYVPLGAFTGINVLSTWGPGVPVRMLPIGSVVVDIKQEFKEAGINQTRHRMWLHGVASVRVILPMVSKEVTVTTDIPVTETVIVGPVPNSLYSGSVGGVSLPAATP